jgi:hypothetical protein
LAVDERPPETPEEVLEALRGGTDAEAFERWVGRFEPSRWLETVRPRLGDLGKGDAEAILSVIEAFGTPDDFDRLAKALADQPDLAPERAWEALGLLEGLGVLQDDPELLARWEELGEELDADRALDELASLIEEGLPPESLGAIEPTLRAEVLDDLSGRLDPTTLATVRSAVGEVAVQDDAPSLAASLVTAIDRKGRGVVAVVSGHGPYQGAAFVCDVLDGVVDVASAKGLDRPGDFLDAFATRPERDVAQDRHPLALGLLAGALALGGHDRPEVRRRLDATLGPRFAPSPFPGLLAVEDSPALDPAEASRAAESILDSCPDWLDDSPLTREIAEEILLRAGGPPDPVRDAGAYRYLFEHRLASRLELDRRMLAWMASFWAATDAPDLALASAALARDLADPSHAVPGHPFIVALATSSLRAAQDARDPGMDY